LQFNFYKSAFQLYVISVCVMNALIISVVWKIFVVTHWFSAVRICIMYLSCKQRAERSPAKRMKLFLIWNYPTFLCRLIQR